MIRGETTMRLKKFIAFTLMLVMMLTVTNMQTIAIKTALADEKYVPTTKDELLMQAFFERTNKDGVKNGVLFAGEKYDPNDINTWRADPEEELARILENENIIAAGGIRVPVCEFTNGVLTKFTNELYISWMTVIDENGYELAVDQISSYKGYGGTFQFLDSPEAEILLHTKEIDIFTCWGVKKLDTSCPFATEFNTRINGKQFTICSSAPKSIYVGVEIKDFSKAVPEDFFARPSDIDYYNLFLGWYDRKTGDLFSYEYHLSNSAFSFDDNIVLEARFLGFDLLPKIGDINADGEINSGDASDLLQKIVKSNDSTIWQDYARYDVNCDGNINTGDAVLILKTIVGG